MGIDAKVPAPRRADSHRFRLIARSPAATHTATRESSESTVARNLITFAIYSHEPQVNAFVLSVIYCL